MTPNQRLRNLHTGEVVRVKHDDGARCLVVNTDTGDRRYLDNADVMAAWKFVGLPTIIRQPREEVA